MDEHSDSVATSSGSEEGVKSPSVTKDESLCEDKDEEMAVSQPSEGDIDSVIQQAATKTNLSVLNVKSILHHVLKDKRVLAVVQRKAAEEEGRVHEDLLEDDVIFEPKLTRSRVREAVASSIASGAMSPEKIARMRSITKSPTKTGGLSAEELLNQTLTTDESSDEEYDPTVEPKVSESDDSCSELEEGDRDTSLADTTLNDMDGSDGESSMLSKETVAVSKGTSLTKKLSTPRSPLSPATIPVPDQLAPLSEEERSEEAIVRETAALLASLSDVILSPIKPIRGLSDKGQSSCEPGVSRDEQYYGYSEELCPLKEGEIAKRTRSKYPLNDTPLSAIEESFDPPDADDPPTPMELDDDDVQWHQWLSDLMNPPDSQLENVSFDEGDDREDTEYNYLADQDVEEKEEFRNDRAVKIPRKEVDELLNELLNPPTDGLGGILSVDGMDLTSAYLLESLGLQTPSLLHSDDNSSQPLADTPQEVGEDTSSVAAVGEDEVGCYLSNEQAQQLSEQIQQHYQLLMQTFVLSRFEPSLVFLSQVAAQAVNEISTWSQEAEEGKNSAVWYVPNVSEGVGLIKELDPNNDTAIPLSTNTTTSNRVPEGAQDVMMNSSLFWTHPNLLPAIGFSAVSKDKSTSSSFFSNQEDYLLVLGMDHYGPAAWQQIRTNLLPIKTTKQLRLRVKNQSSKRTGDNVIKHYKKSKAIKIPFTKVDSESDVDEQKPKDLPQWILQYHKKRLEKEKEEEKKKEKMKEKFAKESRKVYKMLGGLISQQTSRLQAKGIMSDTASVSSNSASPSELGSKRNLIKTLDEATDSSLKRTRTSSVPPVNNRVQKHVTRRKKVKSSRSNISGSSLADSQSGRNWSTSSPDFQYNTSLSPKASVEHLLLAAGLQPSDPSAKFAYSYLEEVKRNLCVDCEETYSEFLEVLVKADKNQWRPAKIFQEVRLILRPWPHLVKLFTELLEQDECLEANVMEDKYEVANIKSFVENLQEKFADSPLGLQEIVERLKELDSPGTTAARVEEILLPLITSHEELVVSMRRFLYHLAPSPREDDVYEDINLRDAANVQPDDFEMIVIPNKSPPAGDMVNDLTSEKNTTSEHCPDDRNKTQRTNIDMETSDLKNTDREDVPCASESFSHATITACDNVPGSDSYSASVAKQVNNHGNQQVNNHGNQQVNNHGNQQLTQDGNQQQGQDTVRDFTSDTISAKSAETIPIETISSASLASQSTNKDVNTDLWDSDVDGLLVSEKGSLDSDQSAPVGTAMNTWTRHEDGLILKVCLQSGKRPLEDDTAIEEVASAISRSPQEVKLRYHQLLKLLQSSKTHPS